MNNTYLIEGLLSIDEQLSTIEMDLLSYKLHMTNLNNNPLMQDITKSSLTDALNHLYMYEDEHMSLYRKDPECDLYDELYDMIEEYMCEMKMSMWRDPEYLDTIYEWFIETVVPYLQSMDPEYTFFADMSYKKHADVAHMAFLICFVKWMKANHIDFRSIGVPDSMEHYQCLKRETVMDIAQKIAVMDEKNAECAIQGTAEWLEERTAVITASVAWKVMDSEANRRSLISEKTTFTSGYNSRYISLDKMNPLQKGHCYEPVSVMLYEHIFNTKIADYGCLRHSTYSFIGASPDGLNIDASSPKYGRLLEIKNVTSRGLTGLPKKEYWVQMQLQMEVCDLDECDFFECDFKEYDDEEAFMNDGGKKTKKGQWKGCYAIVSIADNYEYKYCPIVEDISEWLEDIKKNCAYIKHCYWWLDAFSCVLVPRNRKWFGLNLCEFEHLWNNIEKVKSGAVILPAKPARRVKVVKRDACMIDMSNMGAY